MKKKDLISIGDLKSEKISELFTTTKSLKNKQKQHRLYRPLEGKFLGMIFTKPSTRTRVSFEVGMSQLGGQAIFLSSRDIQLGRGESIKDTALVLSRYLDGIMIRTHEQRQVVELAKYASIPVINGLSDLLHPCQVLSDIFTILEKKSLDIGHWTSDIGLKVAFIGDGNNVANSWAYGAAKLGLNIIYATPSGYEPDARVLKQALKIARRTGSKIVLTTNPHEAVKDADVIYTDVWVSMGQEDQREARMQAFKSYQVNSELLSRAKPDVMVMHCLPAHRGEEITDEVMDGEHSVVFDQAENRLHLQKAILLDLLG